MTWVFIIWILTPHGHGLKQEFTYPTVTACQQARAVKAEEMWAQVSTEKVRGVLWTKCRQKVGERRS